MNKLAKIDLIRERLGVSYERANRVLEESDGDVVAALIKLEKESKSKAGSIKTDILNVKGQELIEKIKKLIKDGNVNKIVVKNDDKTLVEIPVNAGVASLVLAPYLTLLAGAAAMYKDYSLEISRDDSSQTNIDFGSDKTEGDE